MTQLKIENLRKNFGKTPILMGINLTVEAGEFVVLVGPSGCGKSTLLRLIAGLEEVDFGSIYLEDVLINDVPAKQRNMAMVFQSYALYPHKTVRQNMEFALKMRKFTRNSINERIEQAAKILNLHPYLERYPGQLSGGQCQRVAMGRAIVRNPKVFLFDEPLSNLDAKLRIQMRSEMRRLHQRLKTTTIFVTHDQDEAMTLADRIVVMNEGTAEQIGTPLELYDRPKNIFVASFLGSPSMNMIEGTLFGEGMNTLVDTQFGRISLNVQGLTHEAGAGVYLGVRPEHFVLDEQGIEVVVTGCETNGSITTLFFRKNIETTHGEDYVAVFSDRHSFNLGERVRLKFIKERVHLFEITTGARLN